MIERPLFLPIQRFNEPRDEARTYDRMKVSFRNSSFLILTFVMKTSIVVALSLGLSVVSLNAGPTPSAASQSDQASAIATIVQNAMKTEHLRAVIVKVTQGDNVVTSQAFGESMTGVPATTTMHFPNGAVAFAYVSTLLLEFVDEHKVTLDDTIDRWMPTLPDANKVTIKMLANQTSGYPDFETDPAQLAGRSANPLHIWTLEEREKFV